MVIEFNGEEMERHCTQGGAARVAYGFPNEKKLLAIITILNSSDTLKDFKAVQPKSHWLDGDRFWQVAVPLPQNGLRLILEPLQYTTREWHKIDGVKVIEITNYHK